MSSLTNDLQKIYLTKLQIKEVIGTDSDVFEDYPDLIETAIQEGGSGEGLDWDDVAQAGYIVPAGEFSISANGRYNVSSYASTYVDVPQSGGEGLDWDDVAQAGYIVPAGTKNISSNGTVDVSAYANAVVNVPTGSGANDGLTATTAYNVTELYTYMTGPAIYSTPTLYVKGKIAQIDEISSEYSNVTFWINDTGVAPSGGYSIANPPEDAAMFRRVSYDSNGWIIPDNPTPKVGDDIICNCTWEVTGGNVLRHNVDAPSYISITRPAASGSYTVTSNGQYDLSAYSLTTVNVSGGGSGYYYPVHTVSDVTEFSIEDGGMPYMWQWMANELDGESGDFSSAVFTNKYWGYCYPNEFEIMENPVLNFDDFDMGFSMVSYTDLVKREFTYNALPDFNTYKGYTYSYEYANPHYNQEGYDGNTWDEYLTYEFNYGNDLLYSTQLEIVQLSQREIVSPNNFMNGIWRVYDSDNPGLKGYYDETEYGEGNYQNHCWLSIACLSPAETDGGPVTQFTTSYHGAASYTTGFDPRTLIGYTWNAVVNGNGWLIDLVSKGSELLATEMRLTDGMDPETIEQAAYLSAETLPSGHHEYTQEIELSDQYTGFDGYFVAALIGNKYYGIEIQSFDVNRMYGENYVIPATGTLSDSATIGNPNLYVDMSDINNHYSTWSMTLTLHIPDNFYMIEDVNQRCYWTWTFSGTQISQ